MPKSSWPVWLFSIALLLGFPALNIIYWDAVLRSGVLPADGDAIMIPVMGSFVVTLMASPILLGIAWLCLRRYNSETRLAAWRRDRPVRSVLATVLLGGLAGLLLAGTIADFAWATAWYDQLWAGYFLGWIIWLLALRAAVIDQRPADELY